MSTVLTIVKRELGSFFGTWMGYVIGAIALFVTGVLFNAFAISDKPDFSANVLSRFFYVSSGMAMVSAILLSMRLFAEERQTGTIVLFFTSPVTERQLVYGKFISAFLFFIFLQALTIYMPALIFINGKVSIGHLASGYLGTISLGGAVLSLCLLASVVAPNQLIAAILGAVVAVSMLVLWMLASVVDEPFKDLFTYLAIHNSHFEPFMKGIVHSKDLVYYASVVVFGLECSVRVLENARARG